MSNVGYGSQARAGLRSCGSAFWNRRVRLSARDIQLSKKWTSVDVWSCVQSLIGIDIHVQQWLNRAATQWSDRQ